MLKTSSISHSYNGTQRFDFPDINCNPSDTTLILGESGVGKTTLLHILAGILSPSSGEVFLNDISLYNLSNRKRDQFRGQNIGLIFQKPHFVQSLNAEENLWIAQKMSGSKLNKALSDELLNNLNIDHRKNAMTSSMSQGELQRLSIARALINNPKLILADEPTSALDDKNCQEVIRLMEKQAEQVGAALVIVTHDTRLKSFFDHHIELN